jgi:acetyl-CoA acetyltransferase
MTSAVGEQRAMISGVGQSAIGRRSGRDSLDLTIDACLSAVADAGLSADQIDGLVAWPGLLPGREPFSGPGSIDVQDALGLRLDWRQGGPEGPAQMTGIASACCAVAAGMAGHVLCYRTVTESSAQGTGGRPGMQRHTGARGVGGRLGHLYPYGAFSPAHLFALYAQRHFYEFGTTRQHLGLVAVNQRKNAALNPAAVYRTPLSLQDYFEARPITTPFCLYDCDVPIDGSTAVVISNVDYASDCPHPLVRFEAIGTAMRGRPLFDQWTDMTTWSAVDAAQHMWSRTALSPRDVDLAQLYDGFSFSVLVWLEALGFCGKGESGALISSGALSLDGSLPINTGGGQLSAGRLHGFGHLHEAVVQLRGLAGRRQVPQHEVAVVSMGAGPASGCALLTTRPVEGSHR